MNDKTFEIALHGGSPHFVSKRRFWSVAVVLFILALGFRLYGLNSEVLWLDEIASVTKADMPDVNDVWNHVVVTENTPPLYFILLHFWRVLGSSAEWTRLFSTLASLGCFVVTALLARRIAGRKFALLAMFFLAISQYQIYYAQEARVYALLMLTCVASASLLFRCIDGPENRWLWFGYAAVTIFGIHLHYCFWFQILGQVGYALQKIVLDREFRLKYLGTFALLWFVFLINVPILLWILFQQRKYGWAEWMAPMNWKIFSGVFRSFGCGVFTPLPKWAKYAGIGASLLLW